MVEIKKIEEKEITGFEEEWEDGNKEYDISNFDRKRECFGLFVDNELVGYSSNKTLGGRVHIGDFIIKKEFREKGFGNQLFDFMESHYKDDGFHKMNVKTSEKNERMMKFLEKRDYEKGCVLKDDAFHHNWVIWYKKL